MLGRNNIALPFARALLFLVGAMALAGCGSYDPVVPGTIRGEAAARDNSGGRGGPNGVSREFRERALKWFNAGAGRPAAGVALMIHGLNLKPQRMAPIAGVLNGLGYDVLNLSLRGHGTNFGPGGETEAASRERSFSGVTYETWLREAYLAYRVARERARSADLPVFFVGYSLGGLIGCGLLLSLPEVRFNRMVLFAPALRIHPASRSLGLFSSFPNLVFPSLSPRSYRANSGTPMAAYNSLYRGIDHLSARNSPNLNVPSLVFIDPGDELVSLSGLRALIAEKGLSRWRVVEVKKDRAEISVSHLIIGPASLGKNSWQAMTDRIEEFFREVKGGAP